MFVIDHMFFQVEYVFDYHKELLQNPLVDKFHQKMVQEKQYIVD